MTYRPDPAMLPKLGTVVELLPQSVPISQKFELQPAYLAQLPGGELYFDSELQLDTDGWPGPPGSTEPTHQDETSLRYASGESLDANRVSFFVLPLPASWPDQFGITIGDYAAILYKSHISFAVYGDQGPAGKIGEGSIQLFRELGQERIKRDGSIWDTGMGPRVVTIVFPGSGDGQRHFADEQALIADMTTKAKSLFTALGGKPDAL